MKEFIIDEEFKQICFNSEGSIEISGLTEEGAKSIGKDANSAGMGSSIFVHAKDRTVVTVKVGYNAIVLKGRELSVLLNPEDYSVEDIVINIK